VTEYQSIDLVVFGCILCDASLSFLMASQTAEQKGGRTLTSLNSQDVRFDAPVAAPTGGGRALTA
jgi:hypothetical protein